MRIKSLLVSTVLCFPVTAFAADISTKAQPQTAPAAAPAAGYPAITGTGWFAQVGTYAALADSSAAANNANVNLFSAGGALTGGFGYQFRLPSNNFGFIESDFSYTSIGGAAQCGVGSCTVAGPWGADIGAAMGFNWTYPLMLIPAFSNLFGGTTPSTLIPSGLTPTSSVPYIEALADFNSVQGNINGIGSSVWQVAPELRLGLLNYLPTGGGVLKTWVGYEFSSGSVNVAGQGSVSQGNILKAGLSYAF